MKLRANTAWGDLAKQFDQMSGRSNEKEKDPRFFVPGKDAEGNIAVVIRFLPSPDTPPVLEKASHYFKTENGTYSEACPRAYNKPCPACTMAGKAWGDNDKNAYKKWGNKSKYISNIAVINDINNPENNGKVFLWEFGATIYKQIDNKINPQNKLTTSSIIFHYEEGENYNLVGARDIFKNTEGKSIEYDNFKDGSGFVGKVKLTEEEIEKFDSQLKDMKEWLPTNMLKPFDELKERLDEVMTGAHSESVKTSTVESKTTAEQEADYKAIEQLVSTPVQTESASSEEAEDAALLARLNSLR